MPKPKKPSSSPVSHPTDLAHLLEQVAQHRLPVSAALEQLSRLPFEDLGHTRLDHHRALRKGFPEVIYCQSKTPSQVADIVHRLAAHHPCLLGTRASLDHFRAARKKTPALQYHPQARCLYLQKSPRHHKKSSPSLLPGIIIAAAGTSDLPVAEEAALTATLMGHHITPLYDIGVAGLHRLLPHLQTIQQANVIIAVAGMEGALPSVLAGLTPAPVIAVPTSVGYGTSFHGLTALLAMLNSCAPGLSVVNIDNGFGAGYLAASINQKIHHPTSLTPTPSSP